MSDIANSGVDSVDLFEIRRIPKRDLRAFERVRLRPALRSLPLVVFSLSLSVVAFYLSLSRARVVFVDRNAVDAGRR